jgi:hypothetical protein
VSQLPIQAVGGSLARQSRPNAPYAWPGTGASGADEELLWLLGLADPVHLDDDHSFAADVGQVDEHQRASLDGAQPRRLARELPPVEESHRFADGQ